MTRLDSNPSTRPDGCVSRDAYLAEIRRGDELEAELEQAERERDDWKRIGEVNAFKALRIGGEIDEAEQGVEYALACIAEWQERAKQAQALAEDQNHAAIRAAERWEAAEARLAKVPALVEAAKDALSWVPEPLRSTAPFKRLYEALTVWEQE